MTTDEPDAADRGWLGEHRWALAWGAVVVAATLALVAGTQDPRMRHTNVFNAVFDTRWMIAGSRLLAVTLFAWAMLSIGVRVSRGQWIRTFGPVSSEVRDGAEQLVSSQHTLEDRLEAADARIADLQDQLREADRRTREVATMDETGAADARPGGDPRD